MKELLTAIQTQLRTSLTYVRDSDVFITPHENYIPSGVKFPCVGIKDGDVDGTDLMGGCEENKLSVTIIPYVQLAKSEAAVMGDAATGKNGIIEISDDIKTALDGNFLGIAGMQDASCKKSKASEMFGDERDTLQRKIITATYEKQE